MKKMVALAATGFLLGASAPDEAILIFGGSDHEVFLGCLNCLEADINSVLNKYSNFGWANNYGIWGEYGQYGGKYGTYSACNQYTSTPPVMIDRKGSSYGYLSVNKYKSGSVCGYGGPEQVCTALKVMCAHND
jgi:hypothetical protein